MGGIQAVAIGQPDVHSGEIPVTDVGKVFKPLLGNKTTEFDPEKEQVAQIQLSNSQYKAETLLIAFPVLVNYINS